MVGGGAVLEGEQAAAAMHHELLGIGLPVAVEHGAVGVVGLVHRGMQDPVVHAGALVGEALAVQVDLEPGLGAHPEHRALGGNARELVGHDGGTVEEHGGVDLVHRGAGPQAGLDAVAGVGGRSPRLGADLLHVGLEGVEHVGVGAIAAGRDDDALLGGHLDVLAVLVLGDDTGDLAALHEELDHRGAEEDLGTVGRGVVTEHLAAVEGRLAVGIDGPCGAVAGRPVSHEALLVADGRFVPHDDAALGEEVGIPVDALRGVVVPLVEERQAQVRVGVAVHVEGHGLAVDDGAILDLELAVHGAQVVLDVTVGLALLEDDDGRAGFGGRAGGEESAGTGTDDHDVGVLGGGDIAIGDLGGLTQPVGGGGGLGGARGALGGGRGGRIRRARGLSAGSQAAGGEQGAHGGRTGHEVPAGDLLGHLESPFMCARPPMDVLPGFPTPPGTLSSSVPAGLGVHLIPDAFAGASPSRLEITYNPCEEDAMWKSPSGRDDSETAAR